MKYGRLPDTENDCLRELGLNHGASFADIKKKWRELSQVHHPDKGGDQEIFHRVTHAYKMLSNPRYRLDWEKSQTKAGHPDYTAHLDLMLTLPISFEHAFFGHQFVFSYNIQDFDDDFNQQPAASGQLDLQQISINVQPGLFQEQTFVFQGLGHRRKNVRGKTIVTVRPMPHKTFKMEGLLITSTAQVPMDVMICGGTVEVETMHGIKKLKIPPGSQPGDSIQMEGVGLQMPGVGGQFPQKVYLEAKFPTREELKTKKRWKRMKIKWSEVTEEVRKNPVGAVRFLISGMGGTGTW